MMSACGPVPLPYTYTKPGASHTDAPLERQLVRPSLSIAPVRDMRTEADIDDRLTTDVTVTIGEIIRRELTATGAFSDVVTAEASSPRATAGDAVARDHWLLWPELLQLEWDAPYYVLKKAGEVAAGIVFGWVGGIGYSAIPTDMIGIVRMRIRIIDLEDYETVFTKDYVGTHVDYEHMAFIDRSSVRVEMIAKALEDLIQELQADLSRLAQQEQDEAGAGRPASERGSRETGSAAGAK